jgi:hypothetical protein
VIAARATGKAALRITPPLHEPTLPFSGPERLSSIPVSASPRSRGWVAPLRCRTAAWRIACHPLADR